ncbi:MAG: 30S ribosomal protein S16 [Candidatus Marinimicrobia bacterium]|nr:30S ribosomal protein S16 [Candidatus Neomarinimicrobiota bacterium]
MAVRIRMKRLGRRKRPFYRLVAIDSKTRREGVEIERLGWFDPLNKDNHFNLNEDRIKHWLGIGASASHAAKGLFKKAGLSYKWHLEKNGASEEEVAQLLDKWHSNKSLKAENTKEVPVVEEAPVENLESDEEIVEVSAESETENNTVEETPPSTKEEKVKEVSTDKPSEDEKPEESKVTEKKAPKKAEKKVAKEEKVNEVSTDKPSEDEKPEESKVTEKKAPKKAGKKVAKEENPVDEKSEKKLEAEKKPAKKESE